MGNILEKWTVLPHGPLQQLDDKLLTVTGTVRMPLMDFPRRMTVVALRGSRTVIFSPIALDEPEMKRIEALGAPALLVVPSLHHRRDIKVWKQRYPSAAVVTPGGAREAVEKVVPVDSVTPALDDPDVEWIAVPGTAECEAALIVRGADGTSLVVSDIIGNMPRGSGFAGWMARRMGYAGDRPQIPSFALKRLIEDRSAFRDWLDQLSRNPDLKRIIVAHGAVIDRDPAGILRALAATLG